jgi:hypothetical protein
MFIKKFKTGVRAHNEVETRWLPAVTSKDNVINAAALFREKKRLDYWQRKKDERENPWIF